MKLKIIITSTRPGRKGPLFAEWMNEFAQQNSAFETEILDLKEINLPFLDEENHPMQQNYQQPHSKLWSQTINDADAFIVITPEYNHGFSAPLKNALDYLHNEWKGKPMGFLSYGGVSAGTRAVEHLKIPVTTLGMMPIPTSVNIPFFSQFITKDGVFAPNQQTSQAALKMLQELYDWAEALKGMREKQAIVLQKN